MRKINLILLATLLFSFTFVPLVNASDMETNSGQPIYTDMSVLDITLVRQDPYPANPGEYVELLFKVENVGTEDSEDTKFELQPQYPFSLDEGVNTTKDLGEIRGLVYDDDAYQVEYDVIVDEEAISGENTIKVSHYKGDGEVKITEEFDISVAETRADLDVIVSSLTENILSLNVNNIGDKKAGSVTVEIPKQDGISLPGSSTNVVGNLSSGGSTEVDLPVSSPTSGTYRVLVHYTDIRGTRRTVEDEIVLRGDPTETAEVVLEESSGNQITLYVINTGIDPMYSTVARIPEQSGFTSQGTTSNVIGNLDAGDYTVASFGGSGKSFTVEVAYTDRLSIRRTVERKVGLGDGMAGNESMGKVPGQKPSEKNGGSPLGGTSLLYALIGVVGIAGTIVLVKYKDKLSELR